MKTLATLLLCASSIACSYAQTQHFAFAPAPTVERPLTDAYDYYDDDTQPAYNVVSDPYPDCGITEGGGVYSMKRTKQRTYFFVTCTAQNDWWLFRFDKEAALIDADTGDRYMIRAIQHFPLDKFFWIHGPGQQRVTFVLEFPPLPKSVKYVSFYEPTTPVRRWWSGGGNQTSALSVDALCKAGKLKTRTPRIIR